MIFHAMISWPSHISINLWPFVVKHAINLHNATQGNSGLSPLELFSGFKSSFDLTKFHTFGSPVYILEPPLQAGNKILHW